MQNWQGKKTISDKALQTEKKHTKFWREKANNQFRAWEATIFHAECDKIDWKMIYLGGSDNFIGLVEIPTLTTIANLNLWLILSRYTISLVWRSKNIVILLTRNEPVPIISVQHLWACCTLFWIILIGTQAELTFTIRYANLTINLVEDDRILALVHWIETGFHQIIKCDFPKSIISQTLLLTPIYR